MILSVTLTMLMLYRTITFFAGLLFSVFTFGQGYDTLVYRQFATFVKAELQKEADLKDSGVVCLYGDKYGYAFRDFCNGGPDQHIEYGKLNGGDSTEFFYDLLTNKDFISQVKYNQHLSRDTASFFGVQDIQTVIFLNCSAGSWEQLLMDLYHFRDYSSLPLTVDMLDYKTNKYVRYLWVLKYEVNKGFSILQRIILSTRKVYKNVD